MANWKKLASGAAGAGGGAGLNVEDVFSTYLYDGNGSTQTITNGIDFANEGGLLWIKARNAANNHTLFDTERAITQILSSNQTTITTNSTGWGVTSFNSDGFSLNATSMQAVNNSGNEHCSWSFRKAPKFFDIVTYTGTGSPQSISHNLGSVPGAIFVKSTNDTGVGWAVYHRGNTSAPETERLILEQNYATSDDANYWNDTAPTSTNFTVGSTIRTNSNGYTYVAYLFAHNDGDGEFGPDGDADIIKCGGYAGNSSDNEIDVGFEPQWVMIKATNDARDWVVHDSMRGIPTGGNDPWLTPNLSSAESGTSDIIDLTPTGFKVKTTSSRHNKSGNTYIYIAIRRGPMAVPESATDVFDIATRDGTEPHFNSNFDTVDFALYRSNVSGSGDWYAATRLTTNKVLVTNSTAAEIDGGTGFVMDFSGGWYGNSSANSSSYSWMWKRAPNFFDVQVINGNGQSSTAVSHNHNLGVKPEMIWGKQRTSGNNWWVYHKDIYPDSLNLNNNSGGNDAYVWDDDFNVHDYEPTATTFNTYGQGFQESSSEKFLIYLFATLDGVSKVGSYTGNGTSQNIDCGFSSGARFVIIKRASAAEDWLVLDSERGIISGSGDPYLSLNSSDPQFTSQNYIDPYSGGFAVPTGDTQTNNSGDTYIFYAIAT